MSQKEIDRLIILNQVKSKKITQVKAAQLLNISDRQVRTLLLNFDQLGATGIISKKRNKPSNRASNPAFKSNILRLILEKYEDFGPTLAREKLWECHHIKISKETLRKWMIECHIWIPHVRKKKIHPLRKRRECFGELLQGDGSHHDWFEDNNPCTLIYFIDDATNIVTSARFEPSESLEGYFEVLKVQLNNYGCPRALYTDKFSVFETGHSKENLTQFRKALETLKIEWIGANTPQAKGRIERNNRTS